MTKHPMILKQNNIYYDTYNRPCHYYFFFSFQFGHITQMILSTAVVIQGAYDIKVTPVS